MEERSDFPLNITGNDPDIHSLSTYPEDNKIVLIGTSGLRSLEIACKLGGDCTIFIIDNSRNVIDFWKKLKNLSSKAQNVNELLDNLKLPFDNQRAIDCLVYLCELHKFEKIKRCINRTVIIAQDWVDKETFTQLRKHLQLYPYKAVYVYSSI